MIKRSFNFLFVALLAISIVSCGGTDKKKTDNNSKDSVKTVKQDSVKINKEYTDIAKILGGMSVDEKSAFYEISQDKAFKKYASTMDSGFARMKKRRVDKITEWSSTEIADLNKDLKTVFYPFSGPDYLHVNSFFPHAKKYIMFGMEPIGNIPDLKKVPKDKYPAFFNALNNTISDVLNLSFFKTIDMKKEFNSDLLQGTLADLMLFIARTGHEIVDIKPFELDADGKVVYLKEFKNLKGEDSYNYGAEITFVEKGKNEIKTVQYFSLNIADAAIAKNNNSRNFLEKLDSNVVTMLKSASYLMHNTYFSTIRNLIFKKSKAILQDDSGIAYHFIDAKKWNIQFYGTYNGPIEMFSNRFEKDLKKAYEEGKVKKVPFQYGYGKSTTLMLLKKK
jgi:hypothetical protein